MSSNRLDATINRTPNPKCPACNAKRLHKKTEWKKFHPRAGTGIQDGKVME